MVGEDIKCPRCGGLISFDKKCPKCGLPYDEASPYRQRKQKRLNIIAIAAVCVIISILLLAPIVTDWLRSPSERSIINSHDMGDDWQVIGPSEVQHDDGVIDTAFVHLNSSLAAGSCYLFAHSSIESANASYEKMIAESDTSSDEYSNSSADVTGADRAMIYTEVDNYTGVTMTLMFEKGTWVAWIQLHSSSSSLNPAVLNEIAYIQAAKLP